jgi:CO dehydrogenase maturation factor
MEHLSRRTEEEVDHLFIVSDPAPRSLRTIGRILELLQELEGRIHHTHLIITRVDGSPEGLPENVKKEIDRLPFSPEAYVPYDEKLVELDLRGDPLVKISSESSAYQAIKKLLENIGILN